MSKQHKPVSTAQLERRHAAQIKQQRVDRLWNILILLIVVTFVGLFIAVQISHHG